MQVRIIGDDVFVNGVLVAKIVAPTCLARDYFEQQLTGIEAVNVPKVS